MFCKTKMANNQIFIFFLGTMVYAKKNKNWKKFIKTSINNWILFNNWLSKLFCLNKKYKKKLSISTSFSSIFINLENYNSIISL